MPAPDQSVRQLMNSAGYDNDKIGWNPNTNSVTYQGVDFMRPAKNLAGTTFTDQNSFDQANQAFKKNYGFLDSSENYMDVPQRMAYYAGNQQAGQNEMNRVNQKLGYLNSIGDTNGVNAANQYKNQLSYALGQDPTISPQQQNINSSIQSLMNMQQQNQAPYDVYSSPQYAAAQAEQNRNAQLATRQAQESLGAAGFGRSTNLMDRAQHIQNDANNYLMSQVVPGLIQQHNALEQQKYQDQLGMVNMLLNQQQQQHGMAVQDAGLTGMYNGQRTLAGNQNALNNMQVMAQLTGQMPNGSATYQAQQDALKNALSRTQMTGRVSDSDAAILGVPAGTPTAQLQEVLSNAAYRNASLGLDQQRIGIEAQNASNTRDYQQGMLSNDVNRTNMEFGPNSYNALNKQSLMDYRDSEKLNRITNNIDSSQYIAKQLDPVTHMPTGGKTVADPVGLERYILSLGLPNDETKELYMRYGLSLGN